MVGQWAVWGRVLASFRVSFLSDPSSTGIPAPCRNTLSPAQTLLFDLGRFLDGQSHCDPVSCDPPPSCDQKQEQCNCTWRPGGRTWCVHQTVCQDRCSPRTMSVCRPLHPDRIRLHSGRFPLDRPGSLLLPRQNQTTSRQRCLPEGSRTPSRPVRSAAGPSAPAGMQV